MLRISDAVNTTIETFNPMRFLRACSGSATFSCRFRTFSATFPWAASSRLPPERVRRPSTRAHSGLHCARPGLSWHACCPPRTALVPPRTSRRRTRRPSVSSSPRRVWLASTSPGRPDCRACPSASRLHAEGTPRLRWRLSDRQARSFAQLPLRSPLWRELLLTAGAFSIARRSPSALPEAL